MAFIQMKWKNTDIDMYLQIKNNEYNHATYIYYTPFKSKNLLTYPVKHSYDRAGQDQGN